MKKITTEVTIKATPAKVWSTLMDFASYTQWNPFITSISGQQKVGSQLRTVMKPPDGNEMTFKPVVLVLDEHREFRWLGKFLVRGIFDGEHYFKLMVNSDGTTTFVHGEHFSGILVGLLGKTLKNTERGFELMNAALKDQCEGNST